MLAGFARPIGPLQMGDDFARPIANPFTDGAVTVEQMAARAARQSYVPGELVVAMRTALAPGDAEASVLCVDWSERLGLADARAIKTLMTVATGDQDSVSLVQLDIGSADVVSTMRRLADAADVVWSSPNFRSDLADAREFFPNDPQFGSQYHHPLMGNDAAWDITLGDPSLVIAITDDGVELNHADLATGIWRNPGETPGDGLDNDENGYIDDDLGWDFVHHDRDANPNRSSDDHGTHVAGIAGARTNNGTGVAGTAGGATIMPLQFYDGGSSGLWTASVINETFKYAADNGARIVSTSYNIDTWVGDPVFTAGLQYMYDHGLLLFNSAGNNGALNPARQAFEQTLLVANTNNLDRRNSSSNYGVGVDLAAPGTSILSTVVGNSYGLKTGTSMAAPNAAAVAALIWSQNPTWNRDQVATQLLGTADNIDSLNPAVAGLLGAGRVNAQRALTTVLDGPRVKELEGLPQEGEISTSSIRQFTLSFDHVMDPASVNSVANYDLRSSGPDGLFDTADDLVAMVSPAREYRVSTNRLPIDILDGPLLPGDYRMTLVSGGLQDPFQMPLDGDANGIAGGDWQRYFQIALSPPVAVLPLGSLAYHQSVPGAISSTNSARTISLALDAPQTLSLVVDTQEGLKPWIQLRDPAGALIAEASSTSSKAVIQSARVSAPGEYQVTLMGLNDSTGPFDLSMYLNASVELEAHGGPANDQAATAQQLEDSSLPLGTGQASRMAVVASLPSELGVPVDGDDFETGSLGARWATQSTPNGRIQITGDEGTGAGSYAMLMDRSPNNGFALNEAVWTTDLSAWTHPILRFQHAEWSDEEQPLPATFTGSANGDGVSMSQDGITWFRLFNPTNQVTGVWTSQSVDLWEAANAAGIGLGPDIQIKFQQYDDFSLPTDGRGYDEIVIADLQLADDWYEFTLNDGESATVAGTRALPSTNAFSVELLAEDGTTVLATGTTTGNVTAAIANFVDETTDGETDRYLVRVRGIDGDYSLMVTRGADFDTEPNDGPSPSSQSISGTGGVLGYVDHDGLAPADSDDYFSLALNLGESLAIHASLPGDGPWDWDNALAGSGGSLLRLQLRNGAGTTLAEGIDLLNYTATQSGALDLRVFAEGARGEYFLDVSVSPAVDGDFNDDGEYDCQDINSLVTQIAQGQNDLAYDLNHDAVVNLADLDAWLSEAGVIHLGPGRSYLKGDANLDGQVDGTDFNFWNAHKFTETAEWCSGDFNADGRIDGEDFSLWNANKFQSAAPIAFAQWTAEQAPLRSPRSVVAEALHVARRAHMVL